MWECSNRTMGHGFKLKAGRFNLDVRSKFFAVSLVRHWNNLPREAVDGPFLEVLQATLDGALILIKGVLEGVPAHGWWVGMNP